MTHFEKKEKMGLKLLMIMKLFKLLKYLKTAFLILRQRENYLNLLNLFWVMKEI